MILETPEGLGTRPTSDRIKETLFNMISPDIYDSYFLDLFSGSGQMGIEAISRGAREAIFIEKDKSAIACIERNLKKAKMNDCTKLYKDDVISALSRLKHEEFDIIFMDPPYNKSIEKEVLKNLADLDFVGNNTLIIVEASLETKIDYLPELGYKLLKEKTYKTNKHLFIEKA